MAEGESGLIRRLRERVEELEAENENLRAAMRNELRAAFPPEWKLQPMQTAILALLVRRGRVSHQQLHAHLYADRPDGGEDISIETFKVHICRLRKRLGCPEGIVSIHGVGYRLTGELRARLLPYIEDT